MLWTLPGNTLNEREREPNAKVWTMGRGYDFITVRRQSSHLLRTALRTFSLLKRRSILIRVRNSFMKPYVFYNRAEFWHFAIIVWCASQKIGLNGNFLNALVGSGKCQKPMCMAM